MRRELLAFLAKVWCLLLLTGILVVTPVAILCWAILLGLARLHCLDRPPCQPCHSQ